MLENVKTWDVVENVGISEAFFIFLFVYHLCVRFDFASCLSSEEGSLHTLSNVNNKYCIVITPEEKRLQPVNYAWWQQQHTMFRLC